MNKIYKVIWSKVHNCYVVVSELAKRNGKCSSSLNKKIIAAFLAAGLVTSLPMGVEAADFNKGENAVVVGSFSNAWGIDTTAAGTTGANDVCDISWYKATGWAKPRDVVSWKQVYQGGEIRYEMVLKHRDSGELLTLTKRYSDLVNYANFTTTDNNTAFGQGTYALGLRATAFGERTYAGGPIYWRGGDSANADKPGYIDYNYDDNGVKKIAFIYLDGTTPPDIINNGVATTIKRERFASPAVKNATAFGERAVAIGNNSTAFGFKTKATATNATAFGHETSATANRATAFGINTAASGRNSTAFGNLTKATGENATAFGSNTQAVGGGATAFGAYNEARAENSVAWGNHSIVHGGKVTFKGVDYIDLEALRYNDTSGDNSQYYLEGTDTTTGKRVRIVGRTGDNTAVEKNDTFIGADEVGRGKVDNWIIAQRGEVSGQYSTAFGESSEVHARNALGALGGTVRAGAHNSAAIGKGAIVSIADTVALGSNSVAARNNAGNATTYTGYNAGTRKRGPENTDYTTGGKSVWVATHNAIAVGDGSSVTRQITGVAAGFADTDAVNVAQLKQLEWNIGITKNAGSSGTNNSGKLDLSPVGGDKNNVQFVAGSGIDISSVPVLDGTGHSNGYGIMISALGGTSGVGEVISDQRVVTIGVVGENREIISPYIHIQGVDDTSQLNSATFAKATAQGAIAIGQHADAKAENALAVGYKSKASSTESISIGANSEVSGEKSLAIGSGHIVKGNCSGTIGDPNIVNGDDSYAVGNNIVIEEGKNEVFALGNNIKKVESNSVFLGSNTAYVAEGKSTAGLSDYSSATINGNTYTYAGGKPAGVVSIGDVGKERRLQNVAAGKISADSTDAINGSQLYGAMMDMNNNVTNLGNNITNVDSRARKGVAGAAALAALHPLDFDPDDKLTFAAGVGNYRGETAAAIGAFYRPDEKVMFSIGGSMGNGENVVNAGVSFSLDRTPRVTGSRTALTKEVVQLREQVARQDARLARQDAQIEKLTALVMKLAGNEGMEALSDTVGTAVPMKAPALFPDNLDNKWAYDFLEDLEQRGYIHGYAGRSLTRDEFAAALDRAMAGGAKLDERLIKEFEPELSHVRVVHIEGKGEDEGKSYERPRASHDKLEDKHEIEKKHFRVKEKKVTSKS